MSKKITTFILSFLCLFGVMKVHGQAQKTITGNISDQVTWYSDTTYILDGFVFVQDGGSVTIEAGTVIKAETGSGENASALIIKKGGKIFANGTATEPIVFTSVNDADLTLGTTFRGLWGGLIVLGNATHNNPDNNNAIEGVPTAENAFYGGDDPEDNSGVLKYVSIRHGGSELAPDEEINGLTLGAVGSGTEIHHIEVMANDDDGVEWFGGTVDTRFMVVTDVADDSYDIDEGFTGRGQFWFTKQAGDGTGDNFGEHDGGPSNNRWGTPFTTPVMSNVTYVGGGESAGDRTLTLRDFFGGSYYNSIFAEQARGIRLEYVPEFDAGELGGSFTQWNSWNNLKIENNIFQNIGDGTFADIATVYSPEDDQEQPIYSVPQDSIDAFVQYIEQNNDVANAGVTADVPVPTEDVSGAGYGALDSWFTRVTYKGAFNPDVTGHWAGGWTFTFADDTYNEDIGDQATDQTIVSESITGDVTWTSENTYVLDGFIFVEDGATLTIEAGTVVKAFTGTGENASALIVKRGGQIFANGTSQDPIVFTSINDENLDLPTSFKGLWGGLIVLGYGPHNNPTNDNGIEGVPAEENAFYGGDDPDDNSGVIKFVSIRHGGSELAPDEEINGLTLGAVGGGTEIHHVEVSANDDDGVEWFGGNVDTKFMVVTDVADDSYDIDEGFTGKGQFWFTKQAGDGSGDNFGEHDGGPSNNRWGAPFTTPVMSNVTYVGGGESAGDRSLTLREFFGGSYYNSIFAEQARGIRVEYVPEFDAGELGGAFSQWNTWNNLKIENNIFQNISDGTFSGITSVYSPEDESDQPIYTVPQDSIDAFVSYMENNNTVADAGVTATNPIPSADVSGASYGSLSGWFTRVKYKGAFNPDVAGHWAGGWSKTFSDDNYNDDIGEVETGTTIIISDNITGDSTWTSNNTYVLDGFIFVEEGASLTIEEGTLIQAFTGTGENASALIVKRGAQIFANGSPQEPIIFTSINDDNLDLPTSFKGLWGGLIVLGNGPHNNPDNNNGIEGVPAEQEAFYGGDNEDDNSGVLKFVSIRHGGSELAPDEEINGLTLGAVGAGTEIHHVEVSANDDDGVEWFGGNVNTKYMVVTDVGDDSYDIDEGFTGYGQFWFTKQQGDGTGDNFGEHDGGPSNNRWGMPFTTPMISNATYVGGGSDAADRSLTLREFFGGQYHNSIFAEQARGIRVEYVPEFDEGELGGAFTQWNAWDNLKIENNIFQNVADGTFAEIASVYSPEDDNDNPIYTVPQDSIDAFVAYIESMNTVADVGVTAEVPVPTGDVSGAMFNTLPDWFDTTNYKGAFNPYISGHWAAGWTKTFANDTYNDEVLTGIFDNPYTQISTHIYPNPVVSTSRVEFDNPTGEAFIFNVYSMDGRLVKTIENITDNSFIFTKDNLNTGIYLYELRSATSVSTGKVVIR